MAQPAQLKHDDERAASPARVPGLDGLRGLAVLAVIAFHLFPADVPGGFVGVSLFFTLSGFLLTLRLADERAASGRVDLRRYWQRRLRRIMPAALTTLLAVTVVWRLAGWWTTDIARDVAASALNVANWHQIVAGQAYGADPAASPVLHFWSLAIEEQVYLLLPLVVAACRTTRSMVAGFGAVVLAAVAATIVWSGDAAIVYYSTFTRVGEIALGAIAALILRSGWVHRIVHQEAAVVLAVLGLATFAAVVLRTSLGSEGYYAGGLLLVGGLSALTLTSVSLAPNLGRRLDACGLGAVGVVSYSAYLVHWPILVGLRRASVDGWRLPAATMVGTALLAVAMTRGLDRPLASPAASRRRVLLAAATAVIVLVASAAFPRGSDRADALALERGREAFEELATTDATAATPSSTIGPPRTTPPASTAVLGTEPPVAPPTPVRLAVFGDSKVIAYGLGMLAADDPRVSMVGGSSEFGCPLGRSEALRGGPEQQPERLPPSCRWDDTWPAVAADSGLVDVALVYFGTWDVMDQRVPALGEGWSHIGEPAFDDWLLDEMRQATDLLLTTAHHVVWLTVTPSGAQTSERYERYNELVRRLVAEPDAGASLIDLDSWLQATGELDRLLPDGVHASWEGGTGGTAREIGERYLIEQVQRTAASDG